MYTICTLEGTLGKSEYRAVTVAGTSGRFREPDRTKKCNRFPATFLSHNCIFGLRRTSGSFREADRTKKCNRFPAIFCHTLAFLGSDK